MFSLTPAQEPTNTWRSSMSVCPTVSLTLLSLNETSLSSFPSHNVHIPSSCHLSSVLSAVTPHPFPFLPCPVHLFFSCPIPSSTPFLQFLLLSVSHHEAFMKYDLLNLSTRFCTAFIIDVLTVFPENQWAWLWDSRIEEGSHADSPWWQGSVLITQICLKRD